MDDEEEFKHFELPVNSDEAKTEIERVAGYPCFFPNACHPNIVIMNDGTHMFAFCAEDEQPSR